MHKTLENKTIGEWLNINHNKIKWLWLISGSLN
jgi:hypothetical protein